MADMYRIEIMANQAVEEDLFDRLRAREVQQHYTRIAPAYGKGRSGERRGDHVWPEENVMLLLYCSSEQRDRIVAAVREVKKLFPDEGIKLFAVSADVFEL